LARGIEIYVNSKSAYPDELVKQVKDGDNIHITLLLAGDKGKKAMRLAGGLYGVYYG